MLTYKQRLKEWEFYAVDTDGKEMIIGTQTCAKPKNTKLYRKTYAMICEKGIHAVGLRLKDKTLSNPA